MPKAAPQSPGTAAPDIRFRIAKPPLTDPASLPQTAPDANTLHSPQPLRQAVPRPGALCVPPPEALRRADPAAEPLDGIANRSQTAPMTMTQSTPRIALITGASRGLGYALALELAPRYHILAVARTVGGLEELDDAIKTRGGEATLAPIDITNRDAMAHLCRSVYDRWGGIALWAHTAIHTAPLTPTWQLDAKDWDRSVATNVTAMGHMIPFVAPLLGTDGTALFFDDPKGGEKFHGHYGATKAAQIALATSWQAESVKTGPKVHILRPQPMATAHRARFFPGEDRDTLVTPAAEAARLLATLD